MGGRERERWETHMFYKDLIESTTLGDPSNKLPHLGHAPPQQQTLLSAKQTAVGVYVVEEGGLEVLSPNEDVVLGVLGVGDFCGELSSFFHTPCTATVRAQRGLR